MKVQSSNVVSQVAAIVVTVLVSYGQHWQLSGWEAIAYAAVLHLAESLQGNLTPGGGASKNG